MEEYKGVRNQGYQNKRTQHHSVLSSTPMFFTQMSGRKLDIALACLYITFPMLVLTSIFLGLIYRHRVTHSDGPFPNLPVTNIDDRSAYYVDLSSTFVIFIASWMSSLAPVLVGFAVTLAAYRVGQQILQDTQRARREDLLTPYQLSLMLRFINGATWSGLWFWILYILGWSQQRRPQAKPLKYIIAVTAFATLLGMAVFGADTWLHIATKTVNFVQVSDITNEGHTFSLSLLSPNCTATNNSIVAVAAEGVNCGLDVSSGLLVDATEPIRTLNNISNSIAVQNNGPNSNLEFLAISASERDPSYDFSASTYGMRTQCRPITQECDLGNDGNMTYNCGNGSFQGAVRAPLAGASFQLAQFANEDLSDAAVDGYGVRNPYYTTLAAIVDSPANQQVTLSADSDIVTANGGLAFVLLCTTTVYDIQYNLVEGRVVHLTSTSSNTSVTNIWASIMAQTLFGISNMDTAVTAGVQFSQTSQQVADAFATVLSKVSLSAGVQGIVKTAASQVQQRQSILVARVPQGPLFALVTANLSFVVLGAILTIVACTTPHEAREAQTRLSIAGLVANCFEGTRARVGVPTLENMFDEYEGSDGVRVGIGRTEQGGYAFKALEKGISVSKPYHFHSEEQWDSITLGGERREGWI